VRYVLPWSQPFKHYYGHHYGYSSCRYTETLEHLLLQCNLFLLHRRTVGVDDSSTFSCILQYCLPHRLVTGCFIVRLLPFYLILGLQPFIFFIRLLPFILCPLTLSDKRHQSGLVLPPIALKQIRRIACDPVYSGIWEINVRMVSGRCGRQLRIFWNQQGFQNLKQNIKANQAGK